MALDISLRNPGTVFNIVLTSSPSVIFPKISISETFKDVISMYVCVTESWKEITEVKIASGESWKSLV